MFTDDECETIDEKRTFTPAILMFNNDEKLKHHLNVLYKRLNHMYFVEKKLLHSCDLPVVNHYFISENIYNNTLLTRYCINIQNDDPYKKIHTIPNYHIVHFATSVGHADSKIDRMNEVNDFVAKQQRSLNS
jgi:hypothetical protein